MYKNSLYSYNNSEDINDQTSDAFGTEVFSGGVSQRAEETDLKSV